MTGIGPVEPYDPGTDSPAHPGEAIGTDAPRPGDRWAALPARRRRTAAALVAAVAATATFLVTRPDPPPPAPASWPSQTTTLHYDGPGKHAGRFAFTVSITGEDPVIVRHLGTGIPQLAATVTPALPRIVQPDSPARLSVRIAVQDCATLPAGINQPYVELTLRNRRAQQRHSFIFEGRYPRDLWRWIHTVCDARNDLTRR
ncbi:hypothetical protein V2W30_10160 [Streptomyces sp. Q6]|uniref:Uncharacterized protein n=1 Tax=Streptomyces citrinus TaxID=3118173 RepID=A0ACD5A8V1_9ACTN